MQFLTRGAAACCIGVLILSAGCGEDSNNPSVTTPEDLLEAGLATLPRMSEALSRLVLALQGNPQPGVTITPITDGFEGSVGVDLDGNGSMETSVNGNIVFLDPQAGFAGGATLNITGIEGGSVDATVTALVYPNGPADVVIGPGGASITATAGTIAVSAVNLTVALGASTPLVEGVAFFNLDNEDGEILFSDNGQGGQQIQLFYDGEDIIVP